jgi:hypothetical protein
MGIKSRIFNAFKRLRSKVTEQTGHITGVCTVGAARAAVQPPDLPPTKRAVKFSKAFLQNQQPLDFNLTEALRLRSRGWGNQRIARTMNNVSRETVRQRLRKYDEFAAAVKAAAETLKAKTAPAAPKPTPAVVTPSVPTPPVTPFMPTPKPVPVPPQPTVPAAEPDVLLEEGIGDWSVGFGYGSGNGVRWTPPEPPTREAAGGLVGMDDGTNEGK